MDRWDDPFAPDDERSGNVKAFWKDYLAYTNSPRAWRWVPVITAANLAWPVAAALVGEEIRVAVFGLALLWWPILMLTSIHAVCCYPSVFDRWREKGMAFMIVHSVSALVCL